MRTLRICCAANDDGFGPSAFAYYVVTGLLDLWQQRRGAERLVVTVLNHGAFAFNKALYEGRPEVNVADVDGGIRLERCRGEVDVARTLAALDGYVERRLGYRDDAGPWLEDCALAIDIGVPLLARAAADRGIASVTVFDHSWARTLRGICSAEARYVDAAPPTEGDRERAERIAAEIEKDERAAGEVFLFDRYITPPVFWEHWRGLGFAPRVLSGVLGHRQDPALARRRLDRVLSDLGQATLPEGRKLVLISPGGTAVWDEIVPRLIDTYVGGSKRDYLPVLACPRIDEWDRGRIVGSGAMRWFPFVPAATLQAVLPAFELVVSRAGGGIVNDCLASCVPLACIEEHQWQVEQIERECKSLGLILDVPETSLRAFRADPATCVDTFVAGEKSVRASGLSTDAEKDVAELVLARL